MNIKKQLLIFMVIFTTIIHTMEQHKVGKEEDTTVSQTLKYLNMDPKALDTLIIKYKELLDLPDHLGNRPDQTDKQIDQTTFLEALFNLYLNLGHSPKELEKLIDFDPNLVTFRKTPNLPTELVEKVNTVIDLQKEIIRKFERWNKLNNHHTGSSSKNEID